MRPVLRRLFLAGSAFLLAPQDCGAAEAVATLRWLGGDWTGAGRTLRIDPERLQANSDPDKPFQWEPFRLRNVTGCMVMFDIGPTRYVALMFRDRVLHVTTAAWGGEQDLHAGLDRKLPNIPCPDEPKQRDATISP